MKSTRRITTRFLFAACLAVSATLTQAGSFETGPAFRLAVAEATLPHDDVVGFYRANGFAPVWVGDTAEHAARRASLIRALSAAHLHGLPAENYDVNGLLSKLQTARTPRDLGAAEAALTKAYIRYARDVQTGVLRPSDIDDGLVRQVQKRSGSDLLSALLAGTDGAAIERLAPQSSQYRALLKHKLALQELMRHGGWGPTVPKGKYEPGASGAGVLKLRDRLVAMGFLKPTASPEYDSAMEAAVRAFQRAHGLEPDGVAGEGTIAEINRSPTDRLKAVMVAMERERWLPADRGQRHVLVNQADFSAKIVDDGNVTFETRAVIGKNTHDRRSPEFSDEMEHMVINPSWYVPRSIITKEYLPKLRANPNAVRHLEITDSRGRQVNRAAVDFNQFSARSFPFAMRQPPGQSNALGLVKFMFPNKYNIYLHDTPQKSLFAREVRAFSHGCIRLAQPFEFAYALLAPQEEDPKAFFHRILNTGKETKVDLEKPVPVHLIYRTAYIGPKGDVQYRRDVYGRDAKIWEALQKAGVALPDVQG
ncbi:peptidoglycan-binding domain 1 [Ruegeria lacuscaerulensis ITI-1157]|nr:peptidoglycan-binding domain 1 [Ruegeria lacuscaerulensis ITI-1157]SHK18218.1 Murein L,D-transpeptidase YcbB/YkuD [Ruegeria lacuscaerulensis ITI-1157]